MEAYLEDPRTKKVNLGIGVYQTEEGKVPLLPMVAKAELELAKLALPRGYLPMDGSPAFKEVVQETVFGVDSKAIKSGRLATIQTIGGSGALKIGADFLKKYFPESDTWICDPSWDNHRSIFQFAGVKCHTYPYFDNATGKIVLDAMLDCLNKLPKKSIVLLQPSCHNPTGADLSKDQWKAIIEVLKERELIPFMDMAYQGLGKGFDEDAYAIRALVDEDISFFASTSFSKNLSFYGERCGALSVFCQNKEEADRVLGQLKSCVRSIYSSPPTHGAVVAARVLKDPVSRKEWQFCVEEMRNRIKGIRHSLYDALKKRAPRHNFEYLLTQTGMFSYTGMSVKQVDRLREEFGIYIVRSSRICVAAINIKNVDYIADSFVAVLNDK